MELRENRSHCRGVPDDAVLHLASDTLLPGPCRLGTRVWDIGRHSHPDISTSGSSRGKPYIRNGRNGGKLKTPSLKQLCTHILWSLCSSSPCTPRRLLRVWEEQWHQGVRCLPAHPCSPELRGSSGMWVPSPRAPWCGGTGLGAALPPAVTTPKPAVRRDANALFWWGAAAAPI